MIIYITNLCLNQSQFIAIAAVFLVYINVVKLLGGLSLCLLIMDTLVTAFMFIPAAIIGNKLGLGLNKKLNKFFV